MNIESRIRNFMCDTGYGDGTMCKKCLHHKRTHYIQETNFHSGFAVVVCILCSQVCYEVKEGN